MTGLEFLLVPIAEKVVGSLFGGEAEVTKQAVESVANNPNIYAGGSLTVMSFVLWVVYKFFKTPEKILKFRMGFVKAFEVVECVYNAMKDFKDYMKKKCVGGVCELPKDDKKD